MKKQASKRFREHIRQLRKERGWTQEHAAEICGIGYKLYQLYELGIKQNPGLLTLEKIADGFSMDVSELLSPEKGRLKKMKGNKGKGRSASVQARG